MWTGMLAFAKAFWISFSLQFPPGVWTHPLVKLHLHVSILTNQNQIHGTASNIVNLQIDVRALSTTETLRQWELLPHASQVRATSQLFRAVVINMIRMYKLIRGMKQKPGLPQPYCPWCLQMISFSYSAGISTENLFRSFWRTRSCAVHNTVTGKRSQWFGVALGNSID